MAQKFIGITLPARLGPTGMFDQSTTVIQQVRSNFKNLILTKKGERVGQPDLGCDLWKILFDPLTEETLESARLAVAEAVDRWLPFIELTDFQINKTDDENIINIKCNYRFRQNRNVEDEVNILTNILGTATVSFGTEPTTVEGTNAFAQKTQAERDRRAREMENARRIRRLN
jgi:phage baseplate assembly protein W